MQLPIGCLKIKGVKNKFDERLNESKSKVTCIYSIRITRDTRVNTFNDGLPLRVVSERPNEPVQNRI